MPRAKGDSYRPWRVGGVTLGHIRSGIYWIDRTVHGRRFRLSTGCRTPEAALGEYRRFEGDPARFVPRGKVGTGWDQAAKDFLAFSQAVKLNSPGWVDTQEAHLANLGAFTRSGIRIFGSLETFAPPDVRAFIAALTGGEVTGREVGAPTVNRHLATLKGFMRWAREEGLTANRSEMAIKTIREDAGSDLPREIEEADWRPTLECLSPRWRAACEVMLGSGMRYGEVAAMEGPDIHGHGIHVPYAKGRRARTIPTTAETVMSARRLLMLGGVPNDEASQLDHRLEVAARRAKAERFTAHRLRHTYGTVCLRNGVDLRELQRRMGHARLTTTERYVHARNVRDGQAGAIGAPR